MRMTSTSLVVPEKKQSFDFPPQPEALAKSEKTPSFFSNIPRMKKIMWPLGICGTLSLLIGIILPFIIESVIKNKVKDEVIMQENNYEKWGSFPGRVGLQIQRQFTFYNFTNPEDFFVRNAKPIMQETKKVVYQENIDLKNPSFSSDGSEVSVDFLRNFVPIGSSTGLEKASVVNIGPLGFWRVMKTAGQHQIGIQTFATLLESLIHKLKNYYYSIYLTNGLITSQTAFETSATSVSGFTGTLAYIYNDPNYGFKYNADKWVIAYLEYKDSTMTNKPTCQVLQQYFKFTYSDLSSYFSTNDTKFSQSKAYAIANLFGSCSTVADISQDYCLAISKWAAYGTTSVAALNTTVSGYPEISYYYSGKFKTDYTDSKYNGITFPYDWAKTVLWFIEDPADKNDYVKTTSTLLNAANLAYLFAAGQKYEATLASVYLTAIAARFQITAAYFPSNAVTDVAFVFYQYAKYMVNTFAQRGDQTNGGSHAATIGLIGGQALSTVFTGAMQLLPPTIIGTYLTVLSNVYAVSTCTAFYTKLADSTISSSICNNANLSTYSAHSMLFLYDCYIHGTSLQVCYDFDTAIGSGTIAAITSNSFVKTLITVVDEVLFNQYSCYGTTKKCSYYELVLLQWYSMGVTSNPPAAIKSYLPTGRASMQAWFPTYIPWAFEWGYYKTQFADTFSEAVPSLAFAQQVVLLGYNRLFCGSQLTQMFTNDSNFQTLYYFSNTSQLRNYMRWVVAFTGFQMTQTQTANNLLSGFEDSFLKTLAFKNPQEGGDPSINWVLRFNDPNMTETEPQTIYTGKSNINMVRQYKDIDSHSYITYNDTDFEGFSDTTYEYVSPWAENVSLFGTDAAQNPPDLNEDSEVSVFVTSVYQAGILKGTGESSTIHGLEALNFKMGNCMMRSSSVCSENTKYYQSTYDMAVNLTSVKKGPIFSSKTHMYGMSPAMSDRIVVKNINGGIQKPNPSDDVFVNIEPYSGIPLQTVMNLEGAIEVENDLLFNNLDETVLIPFCYVFRSGNLTSDQVDYLLGDLKAGLLAKDLILYIGVITGSIELLVCFFFIYKYYKIQKQFRLSKTASELPTLKYADTEFTSIKPTLVAVESTD